MRMDVSEVRNRDSRSEPEQRAKRGGALTTAEAAATVETPAIKIKAAKIPYRVPDEADLPARLASVLSVLYLIYNIGLDGLERPSLRSEAIFARTPSFSGFSASASR